MHVATLTYGSPNISREFTQSLKNTGFAVLKGHPISRELILGAYEEWSVFFADEGKHGLRFDAQTQEGYFPLGSENAKDSPVKDLKEFYHYYRDETLPVCAQRYTPQLRQALIDLAAELLGWVQEELPADIRASLSEPLSRMIHRSEQTLLRPIHYPPLRGNEDPLAIRAGAHEDINLITLLPAATAPGLEVKDANGNWHAVACDLGAIVVNSGDMLSEATQDYFLATTHRVKNPTPESAHTSRYSMPLFLHPRPDVVLSSRYTAKDYLQQRLREIGLK